MNKKNRFLFERFLNDSSFKNWANNRNQNDIAFWDAWIRNNPENIALVYNAKAVITGITFNKTLLPEELIAMHLDAVLNRITAEEKNTIFTKSTSISPFKKYMATAAVGLLFILVGSLFFAEPSHITHKTSFGEIIDLKLPDGSSVVLNGNSEISYDKKNPRNISLNGQAYFKVQSIPATKAKFWVNTNDLQVSVYGTQFHVNTREQKTDVVLDEGSVYLLLKNGTTKEMKPGEYVSFSKDNNTLTHKKVSEESPYSLWRKGTYVFNNVTLKEVLKNVENAYGITVEFMDKNLESQLLTGGIPNQNLKICLSAIEKSTGTQIVKKDNKLLIFKNSNN